LALKIEKLQQQNLLEIPLSKRGNLIKDQAIILENVTQTSNNKFLGST
jgi:hypothetical protein